MSFTLGTHVQFDSRRGYVSEIVPAGRLPRTVHNPRLVPRSRESYVVTVITERTTIVRGGFSSDPNCSPLRRSAMSLGCKRLWPDPATLTPRQKEAAYAWL